MTSSRTRCSRAALESVVVAPLLGLQIVSAEVPLGQGLSLIRGDALPDAPPEALWSGSSDEPAVLAWSDPYE